MFENLSSKQLARAAQIKEQIERLQSELEQLVTGGSSSGSSTSSTSSGSSSSQGRGFISAAGLAKIKAAQKARWAKYRKEKGVTNGSSTPAGKSGRTMSPAAKAKIRAAAKARWAKAKAAGRTSL